jgi:hypothetical protein
VTVQQYLERGIADGILHLNLPMQEFTTDIRMLVIGNVFEWCVTNGCADFEANMSRSLRRYLDASLCEGTEERN